VCQLSRNYISEYSAANISARNCCCIYVKKKIELMFSSPADQRRTQNFNHLLVAMVGSLLVARARQSRAWFSSLYLYPLVPISSARCSIYAWNELHGMQRRMDRIVGLLGSSSSSHLGDQSSSSHLTVHLYELYIGFTVSIRTGQRMYMIAHASTSAIKLHAKLSDPPNNKLNKKKSLHHPLSFGEVST